MCSFVNNNIKTNRMENKNEQQLNIELTDEIAEGIYSNLAIITHSHSEFILDFVKHKHRHHLFFRTFFDPFVNSFQLCS